MSDDLPPADRIVHLVPKAQAPATVSPSELLRAVASEIDRGEIKATRVLVICVDDNASTFDIALRLANCRMSQAVALCEYAKDAIFHGVKK